MRKLLGSVEVWETDEVDVSGLGAERDAVKPTEVIGKKWVLNLVTKEIDMKTGKVADKATILAHELGHFVSQVLRSPVSDADMTARAGLIRQEREFSPLARLLGLSPRLKQDELKKMADLRYKAEAEAWDIAKVIKPNLDKEVAKNALATYTPICPDCGEVHY